MEQINTCKVILKFINKEGQLCFNVPINIMKLSFCQQNMPLHVKTLFSCIQSIIDLILKIIDFNKPHQLIKH